VNSNATKAESVDAVETLQYTHPNNVPQRPSNIYSMNNNYYSNMNSYGDIRYDWTYGNVRQSRPYHINNIYELNGFYRCEDLVRDLEDERDNLEDESKYVHNIIDELEDKLRDARRLTTSYYRELRRQIENDIDRLESRKDYINDLRRDINKEIRDTKSGCKHNSNSYYYNYYGKSYFDNRYNYDSYYNYNSHNRESSTYVKYENDSYYSEYYPWVNSNLQPVRDGRIYIK
jgi:prefoldin subunit 5